MNHKYDNSERLEAVSDKEWREALDEVTAYLRWRLAGKTQRGAHNEKRRDRGQVPVPSLKISKLRGKSSCEQ